ncbi:MAG: hypothetical protein JW741_25990 [Sedimentisphaerales bacterium]|nr:hypothetical protein [Sedimentisphaerales bacterium]
MSARMLLRRFGLALVLVGAVAANRVAAQVYYVGPGRIVMYKVWSPWYGDQLYTYIVRPPMGYQPMYPYAMPPYRYRPSPIRPMPQSNFYLPPQRPRRYYSHPDTQEQVDTKAPVTAPPVAETSANVQLIVGDVNQPPAGAESVADPNATPAGNAEANGEKVTAAGQKAEKPQDADKQTSRKKPRRKPTRYR